MEMLVGVAWKSSQNDSQPLARSFLGCVLGAREFCIPSQPSRWRDFRRRSRWRDFRRRGTRLSCRVVAGRQRMRTTRWMKKLCAKHKRTSGIFPVELHRPLRQAEANALDVSSASSKRSADQLVCLHRPGRKQQNENLSAALDSASLCAPFAEGSNPAAGGQRPHDTVAM